MGTCIYEQLHYFVAFMFRQTQSKNSLLAVAVLIMRVGNFVDAEVFVKLISTKQLLRVGLTYVRSEISSEAPSWLLASRSVSILMQNSVVPY